MSSSLIAALVLSSSLIGPSSHLGVDAFTPIGSAGGSTSSVAPHVSNAATTALHLSNQPSADSIVSVYGGGGSGANNNNGGGNRRRRSGRNGNNKRRSAAGTSSQQGQSNRSGNKNRRNSRNQNARRSNSNNSPNRQSSARPVARSEAETAKSRAQHLELRSKLEEMQRRNGQGEELSRELVSSWDHLRSENVCAHCVLITPRMFTNRCMHLLLSNLRILLRRIAGVVRCHGRMGFGAGSTGGNEGPGTFSDPIVLSGMFGAVLQG